MAYHYDLGARALGKTRSQPSGLNRRRGVLAVATVAAVVFHVSHRTFSTAADLPVGAESMIEVPWRSFPIAPDTCRAGRSGTAASPSPESPDGQSVTFLAAIDPRFAIRSFPVAAVGGDSVVVWLRLDAGVSITITAEVTGGRQGP